MPTCELTTVSGPECVGWQREFVQRILVIVERHARIQFRQLPAEDRDEAVAEAVAAAFVSYVKLIAGGKNPVSFAVRLAHFAVLRVKAGRHVGGRLRQRDVLAGMARRQQKFQVQSLAHTSASCQPWEEGMAADARTQVAEQAAFRVDFPRWLASQSRRNRDVAEFLAVGNTTSETAAQFGISPGRISQLRQELYADWQRFHGEESSEMPGKEVASYPSV